MAVERSIVDCGIEEAPIYVPKKMCSPDCYDCAVQECYRRLSEYEDTGLIPEQIREMDKLYTEKCREVAELKKNTLTGLEMANVAVSLMKLQKYQNLEAEGRLIKLSREAAGTERDIEKNLLEIECAIKERIERDNSFTLAVLQRCRKLVSELNTSLKILN